MRPKNEFPEISQNQQLHELLSTIGSNQDEWRGLMNLLSNTCGGNINDIVKLLILTALHNPSIDRSMLHPFNSEAGRSSGIIFPTDAEIQSAHYVYHSWLQKVKTYTPKDPQYITKLKVKYPFLQENSYQDFQKIIEEIAAMTISDQMCTLKQAGKIDDYDVHLTSPADDIKGGADMVLRMKKGSEILIFAIDISISGNHNILNAKRDKRARTVLSEYNKYVLQSPNTHISRKVINIAPAQMQRYMHLLLQGLFQDYQHHPSGWRNAISINLFHVLGQASMDIASNVRQDTHSIINRSDNILHI